MPISVTPTKQVDIDLSEAEEGDLLRISYSDSTYLILTAHMNYSSMLMFLERAHMPAAVREHAKQEILRFLQKSPHGLDEWFEKNKSEGQSLYDLLYERFTSKVTVGKLELGGKLSVSLYAPFDGRVDNPYFDKWEPEGVVIQHIQPITRWQGAVEEAIITASL